MRLPCLSYLRERSAGTLSRRTLLSALTASVAFPTAAFPQTTVTLTWGDLLPEGQTPLPEVLQGIIPHENAPLLSQQPASSGVRVDWNGRSISLSGFIVPIDYEGVGVTAFILVPYVGACVHVPPPPANQLVFVTTDKPYESSGLFEAVTVTGLFGVSSLSTQLADIGYSLAADRIEPYEV